MTTTSPIVSDVDLESEKIRWIGEIRFHLWAFWMVFKLRKYRGTFKYCGEEIKNKDQQLNSTQEEDISRNIEEEKKGQQEEGEIQETQEKEYDFSYFSVNNTKFAGAGMTNAPLSKIDDGHMDIVIQEGDEVGRTKVLKFMLNFEEGQYFDNNGDIITC